MAENYTAKQLAQEFGLSSFSDFRKYLKTHGITPDLPQKRFSDKLAQEIRELRATSKRTKKKADAAQIPTPESTPVDKPSSDELIQAATGTQEPEEAAVEPVDDETPAANVEDASSALVAPVVQPVVTLEQRAERIRQRFRDIARNVIEIGFELIAAKREVGHGGWSAWLEREFNWTDRTARNYMNVAERFGNRKTFSDLNPATLQVMLSLPEGKEQEFVDAQAEAGRPVEKQSARELKKNVKAWKEQQGKEEDVSDTFDDTEPEQLSVNGKPLSSFAGFVQTDDETPQDNGNFSATDLSKNSSVPESDDITPAQTEPVQNETTTAPILDVDAFKRLKLSVDEQLVAIREWLTQTNDVEAVAQLDDALKKISPTTGGKEKRNE